MLSILIILKCYNLQFVLKFIQLPCVLFDRGTVLLYRCLSNNSWMKSVLFQIIARLYNDLPVNKSQVVVCCTVSRRFNRKIFIQRWTTVAIIREHPLFGDRNTFKKVPRTSEVGGHALIRGEKIVLIISLYIYLFIGVPWIIDLTSCVCKKKTKASLGIYSF